MSMKQRHSDMECFHCTLSPRIKTFQTTALSLSELLSSSDTESHQNRQCAVIRNNDCQLSLTLYPARNATVTVCHELTAALQNQRLHLNSVNSSAARRHIISHSALDFPRSFSSFAGLELELITYI